MKPWVVLVSRVVAVLGIVAAVLDCAGATRIPGGPWARWVYPWEVVVLAALQLVPAAGFLFPSDPDAPWSPAMKWTWAVWLLASIPMLLLGAFVALLLLL